MSVAHLFWSMDTTIGRFVKKMVLTELLFLDAEMKAPVAKIPILQNDLVLSPLLTRVIKININLKHCLFVVSR